MRRLRRSRRASGVTVVEFALVMPLAFALLLGTFIVGLLAFDQVQLSNVVRDGVRAAAICGGSNRTADTVLPDGLACSSANLDTYVNSKLQAVPVGISISVTVFLSGSTSNDLDTCSAGREVQISASYPQPLYAGFLGRFLGDSGNNRTISASAQDICTQ